MTSSGRRVKRRNLDENDGNPLRSNKTRKSKSGRKVSRKKSSKSKSLRPQRAAAKNALNLFSKITGTSTDGEDEDGLGVDTSESESTLQDSNIESDESDKYLQNEQRKHLKGKEISVNDSDVVEYHKVPEIQINAGSRKKLVLKLPLRDSNKLVAQQSTVSKCGNQVDIEGPSSKVPREAIERNVNCLNSQDPRFSPVNYAKHNTVDGPDEIQLGKFPCLNLSEDYYKDGKIRWGGARARTSKRLRSGEATPGNAFSRMNLCLEGHHEKQNNFSECEKIGTDSVSEFTDLQIQKHEVNVDEMVIVDGKDMGAGNSGRANGIESLNAMECRDYDKTSKSHDMAVWNATSSVNNENMADLPPEDSDIAAWDATASSVDNGNKDDLPPEQTNNLPPVISTKLRLKRISTDSENQEMKTSVGNLENGRYDLLHDKPLDMEQYSVVPEDETTIRINSDHGDGGSLESDTQCDKNAISSIKDLGESHHVQSKNMYTAVYRRAKSLKGSTPLEGDGDGDGKGGSTSNASNHNLSVGVDNCEDSIVRSHGTRSTGLKASTSENVGADNVKLAQGLESGYMLRNTQHSSMSRHQLPQEEWGSSSKMTVGLRSTRNRRGNQHVRETSPIDTTRKSNKSSRKGTWLMLTTHEGGSRYIPQLGDEVVYLRQVSYSRNNYYDSFYSFNHIKFGGSVFLNLTDFRCRLSFSYRGIRSI